MASFKKFEVEIGTNGHIKYKGKIISILSQWNKYEDLEKPTRRLIKKWLIIVIYVIRKSW